jgi:glutathione S-transferase
MHSGFGELRSTFGMNLEASLPEIGERMLREKPGAARDLKRIDAMWREALEASGGPFLFGSFSIADAYFAPVCTRVRTYRLPLAPRGAEYGATCSPCRPSSNGNARRWPSTTGLPRTSCTGRAPDAGRAGDERRKKRAEARFFLAA